MKQFLIAGNWKMNTNVFEAVELTKHIFKGLKDRQIKDSVKVLICPPYTNLDSVKREISNPNLLMGAQNCHFEPKGAFTGEISIMMLKQFNCQYVIVGHSERRQFMGETDATLNRKFAAAQACGLTPVLCIGETLEEREAGKTLEVVGRQLGSIIEELGVGAFAKAVIAYEPVWAIGTGLTATPQQAQDVHKAIREQLAAENTEVAGNVRLLYGGSVKAANAAELFGMPDIDGGLIGGASLNADEFGAICRAAGN